MNGAFDADKYILDTCNSLIDLHINKALVAVSGGVDSSVCAALVNKAGINVHALYIDTGYQRIGELDEVESIFNQAGIDLHVIDASKKFMIATKYKETIQEKRKAFKDLYYKLLKEYLDGHNFKYLVQGTQNATWEFHHNSKNTEANAFEIIEPVINLGKTEIRVLAKKLGLPEKTVKRRPFPGPGLLVRFSGAVNNEKLELISKLTQIVDQFVEDHSQEFKDCYQIFPYLSSDQVRYINAEGKPDIGHLVVLRSVKEIKNGQTLSFEPYICDELTGKKLVDALLAVKGMARISIDLTPKACHMFGLPSHGGTVEFC